MVCFGEQKAVLLHYRLKSETKRINYSSFPFHTLWWSLFTGCSFAVSTFALRHCWPAGWVRSTTRTGFTATGTTRLAVDPAFTLIAAEPLPKTVTFCHFSCRQCCSSLHQLFGSGPCDLICKQMFWGLLVSPCGNRRHTLVFLAGISKPLTFVKK